MRTCTRCGKRRAEHRFVGSRGRTCDSCRRAARSNASHATRLRNTYDITAAEYEGLLALQGGVCAVCGQARRYRLNVDHDHAVEREHGVRASVRGLLCRRCNKLLRDCRDSVPLLRALIKYLTHPPAKEVIT